MRTTTITMEGSDMPFETQAFRTTYHAEATVRRRQASAVPDPTRAGMRHRHAIPFHIALGLALLHVGCVSSSIRSDIERIEALTRTSAPPNLATSEVEPGTTSDVRALLEGTLDPDKAVRVAILNNRNLRSELRELGVARGALVQASVLPNPIFEAEWLPERDTRLELRIEYSLTHLLLQPFKSSAAKSELEARRLRVAESVIRLSHDVRQAFFALEGATARLATAQRVLDAFAASRDAAVALLEAGNIPPVAASRELAAYERARIFVAQLELEVADRREAMQRLFGLHGADTALWRTRGALPAILNTTTATASNEAQVIEASLELAEGRARLAAIATRSHGSTLEGWLPEISVDLHSLHGHPTDPAINEEQAWRFGGGVSLGVPLFDRNQGTVTAYESQLAALAERYQGLALELRSEARTATNRVRSAHARARQYQEVILPAQSRLMEQLTLQYNAMQISVLDLLAARRAGLEVELAAIETLTEYWSAKTTLDALSQGARPVPAERGASTAKLESTESRGGH